MISVLAALVAPNVFDVGSAKNGDAHTALYPHGGPHVHVIGYKWKKFKNKKKEIFNHRIHVDE